MVFFKVFVTYLIFQGALDFYIFFNASEKAFKATAIVPIMFCAFFALSYWVLAKAELFDYTDYI